MADRFIPITVTLDSSQAASDFNKFANDTAARADQTSQAIAQSYAQAIDAINASNQAAFQQFQTIQQQMLAMNQQTLDQIVDAYNRANAQITSGLQANLSLMSELTKGKEGGGSVDIKSIFRSCGKRRIGI
jgi:hypothetical protein